MTLPVTLDRSVSLKSSSSATQDSVRVVYVSFVGGHMKSDAGFRSVTYAIKGEP